MFVLGQQHYMECLSFVIVFYKVAFHTVDNLDPVFLAQPEGLRKGLDHTVVCDCNCRMAPPARLGDCLLQIQHRIQGAHLGMQMKFNPLFRSSVLPYLRFDETQVAAKQYRFRIKPV